MTPSPRVLLAITLAPLLAAGSATAGAQPESEAARPVEVRTSVSRTAVWVGDRITYEVELRPAPAFDIILDDLARERLRVEGGELEGSETDRREDGGQVVHTVRYTLTTYRVDVPDLRVEAIPVRYYRQGMGGAAGALSPAGEVLVPPLVVAIRSTLPASEAVIALRPAPGPRPASALARRAPVLGLGLILLSIVPVALWGLDLARRLRSLRATHGAGRAHRARRDTLDLLKAAAPVSAAERVDACGRLDALVRDHLRAVTGIPAHALTPAEVRRALRDRGTRIPEADVERVLTTCERARYAAEPPSPEDWSDAMRHAETVLAARRA